MPDEMVEKALAAWNAKSNEIDSLSKPIRWPADFTMAQRGQARDCMRAALAAAEAVEQPVAWRVHDGADGWILFDNEARAKHEADNSTGVIQPLYARLPSPAPPQGS